VNENAKRPFSNVSGEALGSPTNRMPSWTPTARTSRPGEMTPDRRASYAPARLAPRPPLDGSSAQMAVESQTASASETVVEAASLSDNLWTA
jgi:hypothetical protein